MCARVCVSLAMWSVLWSWWWRRTTWSCTWTEPHPTEECPASVGWRNAIRWLTGGLLWDSIVILWEIPAAWLAKWCIKVKNVRWTWTHLKCNVALPSGSGRIWSPSSFSILRGSSGRFSWWPDPSSGNLFLFMGLQWQSMDYHEHFVQ